MIRADLDLLRRHGITPDVALYPGHPVVLSFCIASVYVSYTEAKAEALNDAKIPGSGGSVCAALELLRYLKSGVPFDDVLIEADRMWASCDNQKEGGGSFAKTPLDAERFRKRWMEGQDQADQVKPLLKALKSWWA